MPKRERADSDSDRDAKRPCNEEEEEKPSVMEAFYMTWAMLDHIHDRTLTLAAEAMEGIYDELCDVFGHLLVIEYIRFLALKRIEHDFADKSPILAPGEFVDAVWHRHMLDPVAYMGFCDAAYRYEGSIRGSRQSSKKNHCYFVLPHSPLTASYVNRNDRYTHTLYVYEREFKKKPPGKWWPPALEKDPIRDSDTFRIFIRTMTGRVLEYDVTAGTTALHLMHMIEKGEGIRIHQMRLVYKTAVLERNQTLESEGIKDKSRLMMVLRLGGC